MDGYWLTLVKDIESACNDQEDFTLHGNKNKVEATVLLLTDDLCDWSLVIEA